MNFLNKNKDQSHQQAYMQVRNEISFLKDTFSRIKKNQNENNLNFKEFSVPIK